MTIETPDPLYVFPIPIDEAREIMMSMGLGSWRLTILGLSQAYLLSSDRDTGGKTAIKRSWAVHGGVSAGAPIYHCQPVAILQDGRVFGRQFWKKRTPGLTKSQSTALFRTVQDECWELGIVNWTSAT